MRLQREGKGRFERLGISQRGLQPSQCVPTTHCHPPAGNIAEITKTIGQLIQSVKGYFRQYKLHFTF